MNRKLLIALCLFLIFGLALFLRVYFCYEKVMLSSPRLNEVRYAADDGIYHMRLVENMLLGQQFPRRIYFDPYTYFPYGTYIHFAPLYSWLLAGPIWLISLGKPTLDLINKIAPFIPAILGSLTIFVAYFIGKALFEKKTGLLAAFLIALSSPYLYKSLLGATDHHVVEPLFSGLAMLFLILALRTKGKRFYAYTILTGLFLGLYFLSWSGALIFVFIIGCFIMVYYLMEYLKPGSDKLVGTWFRQTETWILKMGIIIFLLPLLMIAPFLGNPDILHSPLYNIRHLSFLILGILGFIFIGWLGNFIRKKKGPVYLLPVLLVLLVALLLLVVKFTIPELFNRLVSMLKAVNQGMVGRPVAREVVSEMRPLSLAGAIRDFSTLFYLSIIALIIIFYQFIKKRKPEYLLIFIWTLTILLLSGVIPAIGQQRNTYYLALNISILAGFLIIKGIDFGCQGIKIAQETPKSFRLRPYLMFSSIAIIVILLLALFFPIQSAIQTAKVGPSDQADDWYEALDWLRKNTPEPGLDYYELYQINPYPYPKTAYGVLARWDVGHMITYYARRIPNANPFQQGLGDKKGNKIIPGSAVFFTEENEARAIQYLDELKTRYVITDNYLADAQGGFLNLLKWLGEEQINPSKFNNSMIAQLHLWDGANLDHFSLIYESPQKTVKIFEYEAFHPHPGLQ